jgi:hypothetical protein
MPPFTTRNATRVTFCLSYVHLTGVMEYWKHGKNGMFESWNDVKSKAKCLVLFFLCIHHSNIPFIQVSSYVKSSSFRWIVRTLMPKSSAALLLFPLVAFKVFRRTSFSISSRGVPIRMGITSGPAVK